MILEVCKFLPTELQNKNGANSNDLLVTKTRILQSERTLVFVIQVSAKFFGIILRNIILWSKY
jgi:hypothetical protein